MWLDDVFWLRAGKFVADHASAYGPIFAPAELQSLAQNVLPLPFTHLYAPGRGIAVLPKGDADQLALSWLKEARKLRVLYADEVFIAVTGDQGPPVVDTAGNHVPTFYDYVDRTLFGKIVRSTWIDPKLTQRAGKPYALIAATSRNGNAGDTLVTAACVELIRQARPDWDCVVTNGDVDRTLVADAAAVIIGPSGMLFDLGDPGTRIDLQNIANFFKFGFLAEEYRRPVFVIGVGHQNLVSRAACDFVGRALRSARLFATRDKETSDLVKRSFRVPVVTAPDLSVVFQDQIASTEAKKERLVTVCGDFREDNDLPDLLAGVQTIGARVQLVAQANEDMTGFEKHRSILQEMKLSIVDCRESQPAEFITRIAQSNALITTRFHALKIALMAGIETGVFCMSRDKRARLLAEISNCPWVRALPTSDGRLKENRNLLLSIAAQGRREPARAVQFDTSSLKIVKEALCAV